MGRIRREIFAVLAEKCWRSVGLGVIAVYCDIMKLSGIQHLLISSAQGLDNEIWVTYPSRSTYLVPESCRHGD